MPLIQKIIITLGSLLVFALFLYAYAIHAVISLINGQLHAVGALNVNSSPHLTLMGVRVHTQFVTKNDSGQEQAFVMRTRLNLKMNKVMADIRRDMPQKNMRFSSAQTGEVRVKSIEMRLAYDRPLAMLWRTELSAMHGASLRVNLMDVRWGNYYAQHMRLKGYGKVRVVDGEQNVLLAGRVHIDRLNYPNGYLQDVILSQKLAFSSDVRGWKKLIEDQDSSGLLATMQLAQFGAEVGRLVWKDPKDPEKQQEREKLLLGLNMMNSDQLLLQAVLQSRQGWDLLCAADMLFDDGMSTGCIASERDRQWVLRMHLPNWQNLLFTAPISAMQGVLHDNFTARAQIEVYEAGQALTSAADFMMVGLDIEDQSLKISYLSFDVSEQSAPQATDLSLNTSAQQTPGTETEDFKLLQVNLGLANLTNRDIWNIFTNVCPGKSPEWCANTIIYHINRIESTTVISSSQDQQLYWLTLDIPPLTAKDVLSSLDSGVAVAYLNFSDQASQQFFEDYALNLLNVAQDHMCTYASEPLICSPLSDEVKSFYHDVYGRLQNENTITINEQGIWVNEINIFGEYNSYLKKKQKEERDRIYEKFSRPPRG